MTKPIYVNIENTKGPWDGQSWKRAFGSIQNALAIAPKGSSIWVAKGTYIPTQGDNRYASFCLKDSVQLIGGFSGAEKELDQRDWKQNPTILSGNIGDQSRSEMNCYHVVTGVDHAVIDGFVVTEGNALDDVPNAPWAQKDPPPRSDGESRRILDRDDEEPPIHLTPDMVVGNMGEACGAGMIIYQCSPIIRNCIFKDNIAGKGAGLYVMTATRNENDNIQANRSPVVENCSFINNFAI